MVVLKHLHDRLNAFFEHRRRLLRVNALSGEVVDLVAWSIMVKDRVLSERLRVPKAVGGFEAYDRLLLVPLEEVSPKAIHGLYRFVTRAMQGLPDSQRADLTEKFREASKFFTPRKTEDFPKLRLVHSR